MLQKTFLKRTMRSCLLLGTFLITSLTTTAQEKYRFVCTDYTRLTDRVPSASNMTFDEEANTFTIRRSGNNNIAFAMDKATKDNAYYIKGNQHWFVIHGSGLSSNTNASYIWWMNGFNKNGSEAPKKVIKQADNTTLLLWDLKEASTINGNFDFAAPKITISSHGNEFISAIGLTAISVSATIMDVSFYNNYEVVFKYPEALTAVGFRDEASLITSVKEKLDAAIKQADALLAIVPESSSKEKLEKATTNAKDIYNGEINSIETAENAYLQIEIVENAISTYKQEEPVYSWETTENGFKAVLNDLHTQVVCYTDQIIRIFKSYHGNVAQKKSLSVTAQPDYVGVSVNEENGYVTLNNGKVLIKYCLKTGQMSFERMEGGNIISEKEYGTEFLTTKDGIFDSYKITNVFTLDDDEQIYGLGQIQNGDLNQRGKSIHLEQDNMKVCIPYFQSTKNYGLFWDNYSPTTFTDNEEGTSFQSTGTEIDYYILVGNNSSDVLNLMRNLTGKSPMPTLWNFGLYQSKERYVSSTEVREVLGKYRQLQVPLDCIVQDWQYWGTDNNNWNALAFENPTYSDGEQMIADVHAQNAKLMISIWANFGPNTRPYKELNELGRLIPVGKDGSYPGGYYVWPYDVYDEGARGIYWKYLYNGLVSKGVDAYWMDSTEPDYFNHLESDLDYISGCGQTWRSLRNAFPIAHISGTHDNHRTAEAANDPYLSGKRVSILTRSAFAGQQRYGANTWSGDVTSSWENFANQIPAACNFSACGIPYWNSDIGGFFTGSFGGVNDPAWRRLYMRWAQFGTFTPMMRFHGTNTPREIYQFGSENDGIGEFDQLLKYIKIRYRMLPYLYSTAWQVSSQNKTFMQALPIAFNEDENGYHVKDQYMFGESFLVAPIIQDAATSRQVYLPANHKWVDFWTGETFEGGQEITKKAPLDILPLYVKAGSIMPWGPDVQYSTEKNWDHLEIRIYPGADGTFTLYEDENDNYNYEKGQYSEIPFEWNEETQTLTIGERKGSFNGMLASRTFNICRVSTLHGTGDLHETNYHATITYTGETTSITLEADKTSVITKEDCTDYIKNPSFETGNTTGWTVNCNTAWFGINRGEGSGDPAATDGVYIFGVWDAANSGKNATISQELTSLPKGTYELTVDMHAPGRVNFPRLGNQQLFANNVIALFKDQITTAGTGDNYPLQTISLRFTVTNDNETVKIGVTTNGAPNETWYKIDNFRLYKVTEEIIDAIVPVAIGESQYVNVYNTNGTLIKSNVNACDALTDLNRGIYIVGGKKVIKQ